MYPYADDLTFLLVVNDTGQTLQFQEAGGEDDSIIVGCGIGLNVSLQ